MIRQERYDKIKKKSDFGTFVYFNLCLLFPSLSMSSEMDIISTLAKSTEVTQQVSIIHQLFAHSVSLTLFSWLGVSFGPFSSFSLYVTSTMFSSPVYFFFPSSASEMKLAHHVMQCSYSAPHITQRSSFSMKSGHCWKVRLAGSHLAPAVEHHISLSPEGKLLLFAILSNQPPSSPLFPLFVFWQSDDFYSSCSSSICSVLAEPRSQRLIKPLFRQTVHYIPFLSPSFLQCGKYYLPRKR